MDRIDADPAPPWAWRMLTPGLIAAAVGVALQLQQARLAAVEHYGLLCALALALMALAARLSRASSADAAHGLPPAAGAPRPVCDALSRPVARPRAPHVPGPARLWGSMALGVLGLALLGYASTGWRAVQRAGLTLNPALQGVDLRVQGVVADLPQRFEAGTRFVLDVTESFDQGQPVRLPPRLRLTWYTRNAPTPWRDDASAAARARGADAPPRQRHPAAVASAARWTDEDDPVQAAPSAASAARASPENLLRPGQRLRLTLRLQQPHGTVNPHGFDAELRDWIQGIHAVGYVRDGARDEPVQALGTPRGYLLAQARFALRQRLLQQATDPLLGGILAALLIGDQASIAADAWVVFRATGVSHLMAISGLHITLFAWLAALAVGALWRRSAWLCQRWPAPRVAIWAGLLMAAGYAALTGWGVPAQRTVLMLSSVGVLRLAGQRWPWSRVWLLAGAAVLALDPWALLQPGFWLSFVAVGLLFATDTGASTADPKSLGARFRSLLREQTVITLALSPLSLLLFGQVSIVGLLANLVAIPWITLGVVPLTLAGMLWPPLWSVAQTALGGLMPLLQALAGLPWALLEVASAPLWVGGAALLGALAAVLRLPWPLRALGLLLMLPQLLWQPPTPAPGQFSALAADVGQGSAVLVRTAGHALLFDAGPRYSPHTDAGHRILVPLLRALGVKLDALVLSHPDSDHVGGAAAVLASQPQAQVISPVDAAAVGLSAVPAVQPCVAGRRWVWDGVVFELLHPPAPARARARQTNALSCVLRVATAQGADGHALLLTGDIERPQEARLVQQLATAAPAPEPASRPASEPQSADGDRAAPAGALPPTGPRTGATVVADLPTLRADVLVAAHHGSKSSSSEAFLRAVQPRWVWVQAGYRNRFGHPSPEVMARYAALNLTVMDTVHCGALLWRSDQPGQVRCQREQDARYWHHHAAPWTPQTPAGTSPGTLPGGS
ncbi:MAG: DNA internalization-related competence protein ComEC/Rec2 [Rhodoferax sp.]